MIFRNTQHALAWPPCANEGGRPINEIFGNTTGLKPSEIKALERLYRRRVPPDQLVSLELARTLTEQSLAINRQIGVLIDRGGEVIHVIVGDAHRIVLPDFGRTRAGLARFRGIRLVLTQLTGASLSRDTLTDLILLRLDLCLVLQVLASGLPGEAEYGYLIPPNPEGKLHRVEHLSAVHALKENFLEFIRELEGEFGRTVDGTRMGDTRDRAILVGLTLGNRSQAESSLQELGRLADTAGLLVLDTTLQTRPAIDPKYVVGKGKLEDIIVRAMQLGADVIIFDMDIRPSQLRAIADQTDLKVLDRTQLILDIFAQHAESRSGKLQVEVAQLRYLLPRLNIMTTAMSRLKGGIGLRGPGETKLEINRRRADERLTRLNHELERLAKERNERRKNRERSAIPVVALVGYTNAGKSTLLNVLTRSTVRAEDRLFATLDPVSRRLRFPQQRELLLIDTVGFIHDLPKGLLEAFKATMEEISRAHLILHLIDSSEPEPEHHIEDVEKILEFLEVSELPRLKVWSKLDLADREALSNQMRLHGGLAVSASTHENLNLLLKAIEEQLWRPHRSLEPRYLQRAEDSSAEEGNEEGGDVPVASVESLEVAGE